MELFLMRHGEAGEAPVDRERRLTKNGESAVALVASALKAAGADVEVIWHSPYVRAAETAAIVGNVLGVPLEARPEFTPEASPHRGAQHLLEARHVYPRGLLLVAHLPILPGILNVLAGGQVSFSTAAVSQLAVMGGSAMVLGHYSPAFLGRLHRP